MTLQAVLDTYRRLPLETKSQMEDVIQSVIDEEEMIVINSSELGNKILRLASSVDWKRECGPFSRQCFGILLRDYLAEQPDWSEPFEEKFAGRKQKIYYLDVD
ncbi:hypothetical protein [Novipirellula rosea]|uniref:Uncharacterized protein n=1 Tax=Novipirellula rosea TaxID=1031540 RepID=A0ABP8N0D0_9BACT